MAEEKALAKFNQDIPSFLQKKGEDLRGTEHLESKDIQIPRLNIAQGLSPEMDPDKPRYIEGLKLGEMFNSMTQEIYGTGPREFYIIKANKPRGVEFIPREQGGGIKDRDVPLDDPRMQWRDDKKPTATLFYDYVITFADTFEMIGLSFKSTGIKTAKMLNGLIAMRKQAVFAGKYEIRSVKETNAKGTFGTFSIRNAGWVETEELFSELEKLYLRFQEKEVTIHEEESQTADPDVGDGVTSNGEPFTGQF